MTALALAPTAGVLESVLPAVSAAIGSAATAVEAAAILPIIVPVATAASGLSVLAAGAAAYDWQSSEIEAARNIAAARYCSGSPGSNGCPTAGLYKLRIQPFLKDSSGVHVPQPQVDFEVTAPYHIAKAGFGGGQAWLLFGGAGNPQYIEYDFHSDISPEIVFATRLSGDEIPWDQINAGVRAAMASKLQPGDLAPRVAALPQRSLQAGDTVPANTIIVTPDGNGTVLGEPYKVADPAAAAPVAAHPYAGPVPLSPPRPGERIGAAAPTGAGAGAAAPTGAGAGAGTSTGVGVGAGVSASAGTAATVGAGATVGTSSLSQPTVGQGVRSPAITGGNAVRVGNTTTYRPTSNVISNSPTINRPNVHAPTVNAPGASASASNSADLERIAAAVGAIPLAVGAVMTPAIANLPDATKVQAAAAAGSCQAMNGEGGCGSNPIGKLKQGVDALGNKLDSLGILGEAGILARMAAMEEAIQGSIRKVGDAVNSDRVLAIMTYMNTLHNAYMLSSDLTQTLFSLTSNALNLILQVSGFKSATEENIDVAQEVGGFFDNTAKSIFGVQTWTGIKQEWAALNRVYQAGANILGTVRGMFDSARQIQELAAENIGKVGNALKRDGVVEEKSFKWMPERVNSASLQQKKWDNVLEGIESLSNVASSLDTVIGETTSIVDGLTQLQESRKEFDKALKEAEPKERPDNEPVKAAVDARKAVSAGAVISSDDLVAPGVV
jgi:hypothetical protein